MTLLARDERDIVEQHLAVPSRGRASTSSLVTDHASSDGTEDVLAPTRARRSGAA